MEGLADLPGERSRERVTLDQASDGGEQGGASRERAEGAINLRRCGGGISGI